MEPTTPSHYQRSKCLQLYTPKIHLVWCWFEWYGECFLLRNAESYFLYDVVPIYVISGYAPKIVFDFIDILTVVDLLDQVL